MSEPLVVQRRVGDVAEIRFNRPDSLNALSVELAAAFAEAVEATIAQGDARAILLAANGRGFVAGGDLAAMGADPDSGSQVVDTLLSILNPAILALAEQDAPVVAAVRGVAAGAGFAFMLGADLVVADRAARFSMAYGQIGGVPDCGSTWYLARRLPRGAAHRLVLLGETLTAEAARDLGLVSELCDADAVEARALELAQLLASGPTKAFGAVRRLLDRAGQNTLAEQLEAERAAFVAAAGSEDFRAGVAAFLGKTRPRFTGR
ncbi:enoyl-CoA hydratase-related protein [Roseibacterium sp. SDUM158016]|uniref:enoyl-CoA hydratase/isomerase family protein n=1 Tax=Roseicyclus sediminis TaxID=2980997 RepID=UPI0021D3CB35|nr:enoyl-CoA hydratase-related protein [Roseibacterium sp. SDUM158016]MCU4652083.1 enoyl-CoA hydratase-related protein [Roseibacterium sp. SDUM158016]